MEVAENFVNYVYRCHTADCFSTVSEVLLLALGRKMIIFLFLLCLATQETQTLLGISELPKTRRGIVTIVSHICLFGVSSALYD